MSNWDSARKHGEQLKRRQKQRRRREHETLHFIFKHVPVLLAVSVLLIWLALGLLQGSQGLPGLPGARGKQGPLVSTFYLASPNLEWLRPCGWGSTTTFLASCSSTGRWLSIWRSQGPEMLPAGLGQKPGSLCSANCREGCCSS